MFAKLAIFDVRRQRLPRPALAHHNDNHVVAGCSRAVPQRLTCRWRMNAAGRLECSWASDPAEETDAPLRCLTSIGAARPARGASRAVERGSENGRAA